MDLLIHQIFSTMLFFASRVMNGDAGKQRGNDPMALNRFIALLCRMSWAEVLEKEDK
jgi:hypothetical protein